MKRCSNAGAPADPFGTEYGRPAQRSPAGGPGGHIANFAGRIVARPMRFLVPLMVGACLTGCSFLKPAPDTSRQFLLSPLPSTESAIRTPGALLTVVVRAKVPSYLFNSSLAVRK